MSDDQFKALCNTFGFAPSRALRELVDCVRAQEIEACAKACESVQQDIYEDRLYKSDFAAAIRARKENT